MKIGYLFASAAMSTLLVTNVIADNAGIESNYEIQNTYQYEYSDGKVPEWAEQKRERHTQRNRLQTHFAEDDAVGLKLEAQNRYQHRERNQHGRAGGGDGRSGSQGSGGAGAGAGKGSKGRH